MPLMARGRTVNKRDLETISLSIEALEHKPSFIFRVDEPRTSAMVIARLKEMLQRHKAEKAPKAPAAEPTGTIICRDYFYLKYKQVFGKEYVASFGKDGMIFKDLTGLMPATEVQGLIEQFFVCDDAFVLRSGYTTGVFKAMINKLRNPVTEQDAILKQAGLL